MIYCKVINTENDYYQIAGMEFDLIVFENNVHLKAEVRNMCNLRVKRTAALAPEHKKLFSAQMQDPS